MSVTIYHNPRCSKSRKTLELITESGVTPTIVEYLKTPPTPGEIIGLAGKLGVSVAEILRSGEAEYKEATDVPALENNDALADWIAAHPKTLQRPIVVNENSGAAVVGRPPENVLGILDE